MIHCKHNLLLLILLTTFTDCLACQCHKSTYRFLDNLSKYDFVGLVEVIGRDTVVESKFDYTFTIVRIINQYHGDYIGHNLSIVESKGFECITRMIKNKIGDKAIIKGFLAEEGRYFLTIDSNTNRLRRRTYDLPILELSLCDENQIFVNDNNAMGHVTMNKPHSKFKFGHKLNKLTFGLISNKAFKRGWYLHSEGMEEFTLERVSMIIYQRLSNY